MRILHVTQGYTPAIGGTEWLIQRISEELVRQFDDEVTVFTTHCYNGEAFFTPRLPRLATGWEMINGVRVLRFPVYSRISWLLRYPQSLAYHLDLPGNQYLRALAGGPVISGLVKAINNHPADLIVASSFPLLHMFAALKGAEASHRPCVFHGGLHPDDAWGFDRPMIYNAIQRAAAYIANTDFEADYLVRRGIPAEKITPIGVGVDIEPFEKVPTAEAKTYFGINGKTLVGFVGQLGIHKGADTLVRAMPLVWQVYPDTHFLIAGGQTLFSDQLQRMVSRLPEDQQKKLILKINFPNTEKPYYFSAVDVFVYPSGFESFGIAYLEAWACHKPVIGCRRGAVPWVITAGRDGLLVDYQNEYQLAEAILLLLSNRIWARSLGEAGYQKVIGRYNWPEIARRFRQVYLDVL